MLILVFSIKELNDVEYQYGNACDKRLANLEHVDTSMKVEAVGAKND